MSDHHSSRVHLGGPCVSGSQEGKTHLCRNTRADSIGQIGVLQVGKGSSLKVKQKKPTSSSSAFKQTNCLRRDIVD